MLQQKTVKGVKQKRESVELEFISSKLRFYPEESKDDSILAWGLEYQRDLLSASIRVSDKAIEYTESHSDTYWSQDLSDYKFNIVNVFFTREGRISRIEEDREYDDKEFKLKMTVLDLEKMENAAKEFLNNPGVKRRIAEKEVSEKVKELQRK